jgi:hypothetical protein
MPLRPSDRQTKARSSGPLQWGAAAVATCASSYMSWFHLDCIGATRGTAAAVARTMTRPAKLAPGGPWFNALQGGFVSASQGQCP